MFTRRIALSNAILVSRRFASNESKEGGRRFMQTIPSKVPKNGGGFYGGLNYKMDSPQTTSNDYKWSKHSLSQEKPEEAQRQLMGRRSRTSRFAKELKEKEESIPKVSTMQQNESSSMSLPSISEVEEPKITPTKPAETTTTAPRRRRTLKPRKALITLSSAAIDHLKGLLNQPEPQLIRIGVKNRGCSGLTYHLEYVTQPGKFDETVEQDGVKVLIDSKALFSIVGSEMDWLDDKLSSRFIFKNPNSKGTCGCGESFMV